jgi:hypothetical protein
MTTTDPEGILAIPSDRIGAFIRKLADARRLSPLMKRLNADLLGDDPSSSALAARALRHLGFVDTP